MYTKAKDSLIEAYGGVDSLPKDFMSIKPNFIEQLKEGFNMNITEEDNEEQQQQQQSESERPMSTQVGDCFFSFKIKFKIVFI